MTIATRVGSGYLVLSILALTCGAAGYWGVNKLSGSLEYVTGPAWNTADGAMEGVIGIEAQMLGIERTLSGDKNNRAKELFDKGRLMEEEALGRMTSTGLADSALVERANAKRREFRISVEKLKAAYAIFESADRKLESHFFEFQEFMESIEKLGDAQVEVLRDSPNRKTSWNEGLKNQWHAADGAMESQIGLLQRHFFYTRLIRGINQNETLAELKESERFMAKAATGIVKLPLFRTRQVPGTDSSYSSVIRNYIDTSNKDFSAAIDAYLAYQVEFKRYQQIADELLDILEKVEAAGDSTVENQQTVISTAISSSYFLVFLTVVLSVIIAVVGSIWIVRSIMNPLNKNLDAMNDITEDVGGLTRSLGEQGSSLEETPSEMKEIASAVKQKSNSAGEKWH